MAAGVLVFHVSALAIFFGVTGIRPQPVLHVLGVPALEFFFMDLHGVVAWCEADAKGIDPASEQSPILLPDGSSRPNFLMNYPPAVLWLRHVGLTPDRVSVIGLLLGVVYFVSFLYLLGRCGAGEGFLWAGLLVSPLSLLVVERANFDILVFACFAFALLARRTFFLSGGSILLAGLLKFYPGAGLAALWMSGKSQGRLWAGVFCGVLVVYLLTLLADLPAIGGSLQDQSKSSFGADVAVDIFLAHGILEPSLAALASSVLKALAVCAGVLGVGLGFFWGKSVSGVFATERSFFSFWLAAPMSIVLFILSNQMDYKWIFFLFLVPLVLECVRGNARVLGVLAKIWLAMLAVYSYWTFFSGEESLRNAVLKQAAMWVIFLATTVFTGVMLTRRQIPDSTSDRSAK